MKEQHHEVVVQEELRAENVTKEALDVLCRFLSKNVFKYYQRQEASLPNVALNEIEKSTSKIQNN